MSEQKKSDSQLEMAEKIATNDEKLSEDELNAVSGGIAFRISGNESSDEQGKNIYDYCKGT